MRRTDFRNLADVVRPVGGAERDKPALVYQDRATSYAELDRLSSRLANLLIAHGVAKGDRVAILSKNNIAQAALPFACAKAGAIHVPVNWRLAPPEVAQIVADADPALIFVETGLEGLLAEAVRTGRTVIEFTDDGTTFDLSLPDDDRDPAVAVGADDVAMLIYTSGTTGLPKGAMLSHGTYARYCELDAADVPHGTGVPRDAVALNVLPLFHVGGLEMQLRPLFSGATVVMHRDFDPGRIIADIPRHRVTIGGLVPTALQMVLNYPDAAAADFSSLKTMLYGAAPIQAALLRQGLDRLGCDFVQSYGMTEAGATFAMLRPDDHRDPDSPRLRAAGSPIHDTRIRIIDEDGADRPTGQIGEVALKSAGLMQGYWRRPEATAETFTADGWLRTGDAGYLDADGYVYVCDRVKDMIQSGGENVYPAEVESAIYGHPAVAEVAVIGVPDDKWGEAVRAVIVPKPGATVEADAIITWARERIAGYKVPRSVVTVAELPKNATGKVLRREVRAQQGG